jgi:two-component system, NtrC family, nitrogen regulation sensor histidine kinase GlnL
MSGSNAGSAARNQGSVDRPALRTTLLNHIHELTSLLTEAPDLDRVFHEILDRTMAALNFDRMVIMLLNEDGTKLKCQCMKGLTTEGERHAWDTPFSMERHDCYETRVVRSGLPLYIQNAAEDPGATPLDQTINQIHLHQGQERKSLIYVPLKHKGKILGFIGADRYRTRVEITQEEIEALVIFANQASIVIENARLYNELQKKQVLLEGVIKCSVDGIVISDIMGNILHFNPKAEEILGLSEQEARRLLAQDLSELDEGERDRLYRVFKRNENISHYERTYVRRDGKRLVLNLSCFAIVDEDEKTLGVVTEVSDVTEKKRMDDYLVRVEKFAALGHIASVIAHEIRNPLSGIATTVQNLEMECEEDSPQKKDLKSILEEVDRLEKMLRETLDLARPLSLQMEEVDVIDLLSSTLALLSKEALKRNITFKRDFDARAVRIKADPQRLRQVFLNLALNAIDAVGEKGEIVIRVATTRRAPDRERKIIVNFKDNGVGIPAGHLNRIFDPFFTTKKVGTGLGLAVSHRIIQDHNGMIEVESHEKRGTNFRITLPLL